MIIGVPWRQGCPHRERAWSYIEPRLRRTADRLIVANPDPFTRAAARNMAVDSVASGVVILHDADMLLPDEAYGELTARAEATGRLVIGYHQYRPLDHGQTLRVLAGADPFDITPRETTEGWSVGGVIALTAESWREVGGMDPRFRGWGGEDFAFAHACSVVLGPIDRLRTPAVHLWHPHAAGTDPTREAECSVLMARYTAATTTEQIREVQCA